MIFERTGVILTHDEITFLCVYLWHCSGPDEFYSKMDSLSDEELKEVALKAKMRKPKLSEIESVLYA